MPHYVWAAAFAFVGMCAAIAYSTVYAPPEPKSAQVVCIEQRGKWIASWSTVERGTCEFAPTAAAK